MTESADSGNQPRWCALDPLQRRVLGVLIEKAKTTPDGYPMTVNAIRTGCNQKSNRDPQMDLGADDVQATLDELRELGAVAEVHGDGRAIKYRHKAYEWLGVDKVEIAVVTELLLRGPQTVGELRGRAARMEPIEGLAQLQPVLDELVRRKLVVPLTPAGRGQVVTHGLYPDHEQPAVPDSGGSERAAPAPRPAAPATELAGELDALKQSVEQLSRRVTQLEQRLG